ncbi:hypothetical protein HDU81_005929 [Chytriomyces hyalinus]|nr:hypothetical protein HDU81_005929 [Chytriomyces hyalinus]
MAPILTAGEECKSAAQALSAFTGTGSGGNCIPKNFISMAMAIAIFRGETGVAMVRLKSGDWSAPCAILLEVPHNGSVQPGQDTVLLFMTESSVLSLVARTRLILNTTHKFEAGIYSASASINSSNDMYVYVRFNNNFTPGSLLGNMAGWGVREDMTRHSRWHGPDVTWADVLMNKITVDRSSIGNALYLVTNIAAGGNSQGVIEVNGRKNFADLEKLPQRVGLDDKVASRQGSVSQSGMPQSAPIPPPEVTAEQQYLQQQAQYQQLLAQQQQQEQYSQLQQQQQLLAQQQQQQQSMQPQQMGSMYGGGMGMNMMPQQQQFQPQQQQVQPGMYGGIMTQPMFPSQGVAMSPTMMSAQMGGYATPPSALGTQSPRGGNSVSQELLVQQAQHQITSAQFAVGTNSIEEQLRRLKQQTQQIEQEQQQLRMAREGTGPNAWMYPK